MGFASYLEDIVSRVTTIERIANDSSTTSYKRVNENEELRKQNQRLQGGIVSLRKEIGELQKVMQQIKKEYTVKDSLLQREVQKTDDLRKEIAGEKDLRNDSQKRGLDLSELVIDYKHRFQAMNEITSSSTWHKDSTLIKQLKSIIEAGLRLQ